MLKILQIAAHGGFGGGERVLADLSLGLDKEFRCSIAAPPGILLSTLQKHGLDIYEITLSRRNIQLLIKKIKPDIVHAHGTRAAFWARLAMIGLKNKPPLVYTLHGFHLTKKRHPIREIALFVEKFLNRWTDTIVCVSKTNQEEVLKYKMIDSKKIWLIHNGIDFTHFEKKESVIPNNQLTVTSIARLHPQKDLSIVLNAVKLLAHRLKLHLLIVGDGPLRRKLEAKARKLKIESLVSFLGVRNDIPRILHQSDIVVLSTNWEGLPIVPLEAAACGKPVIASNVEGVREVIVDGETGLLFQPGSANDLAEKILTLANSPELQKRLGDKARAMVERQFSCDRMVDEYCLLYKTLVNTDGLSSERKENKHILQVNKLYHPWIGGVETVVKDIAEGLNSKNGLRIDVLVCNSQRKNIIEQTNEIKVFRAHSFGIFLGMPISLDFLCLYRKLEKEYDLIFLHYPFPLGFIAYAFFSNNKNLVIWYHSDIVRQKFLEIFFKPFHFYALKKAKKIFVSSPNLIESSSCLKRLKDKCTVIPFGIDLEKFKFTEEIKNKYDGPLILSVGRFTYYKGFEYLIQSARNINAKFLLIGEGVLQKKYINLIKKYNLENKFFLISPVKNLIPYYYACDVFVLPSIAPSEAFGLVLLEAMACGKPLISTELNTGTSFVNQDGITGFVIPPKNSERLTQKINIILNDKDLRSRFSQNSFERSKEFSKDIFNKRLYEELIKI